MSAFAEAVRRVVGGLAPGEVVSYGEVAAEAGAPGAARAVGRVLGDSEGLPWWRVVTADGRLVPGLEGEQARRLAAEGVAVRGGRVGGMPQRAARLPPGHRPPGSARRAPSSRSSISSAELSSPAIRRSARI